MFLEDPDKRISLEGIAVHPWVTSKELPTIDELGKEIIRLNRVRQGEINHWVMREPESYSFIGNGIIKRA
jgi:hypothetical protein